ncbi:hypothetical protein K438DRAFT_1435510, partial [Mycena galopus ATCC 62051]
IGPFWLSTVVAGLLGGEVWVAETKETADSPSKIVGCAVWFGPGHTMYDSLEQQKHSLVPLMASFSEELKHWWHLDTKQNSWHLQTLAVDPEFQRQGAARALVNEVVEK